MEILIVLVLIFVNGFLSMSEMAVVSPISWKEKMGLISLTDVIRFTIFFRISTKKNSSTKISTSTLSAV